MRAKKMVIDLSELRQREYKCIHCGETFTSIFALLSHEEKKHKEADVEKFCKM